MGRNKTGSTTTGQAIRIELSYLMKNGYIQRGKHTSGLISWTDDSCIGFESFFNGESGYLKLNYNIHSHNEEKTHYEYKIDLTTIQSNLGIGRIIYFVCPVSGMNCRKLYRCYGSHVWKHREAYQHRIYYNTQICSKRYYHTERYFDLEKRLDKLKRPVKSHYKGKATQASIHYQRIQGLKLMHDMKRLAIFDELIQKHAL